ncbi:regulator of G-protein signaling [Acrasis kona]|uniref:Regulator of G-protein signaling n=1 Tax=Acrasis kona TaxID=1008807 RepID=A0AAW2YYK5_9EUKA
MVPSIWFIAYPPLYDSLVAFIICFVSFRSSLNYNSRRRNLRQQSNPTTRRSVINGRRKTNVDIILEDIFAKKEFLTFAEKSFCPETILAYNDIQEYKSLDTDEKRKAKAAFIYEQYLNQKSAPLLLNLPNYKDFNAAIEKAISFELHNKISPDTPTSPISPVSSTPIVLDKNADCILSPEDNVICKSLFDKLERQVKIEMLDTYVRFKRTLQYKKITETIPELLEEDLIESSIDPVSVNIE